MENLVFVKKGKLWFVKVAEINNYIKGIEGE